MRSKQLCGKNGFYLTVCYVQLNVMKMLFFLIFPSTIVTLYTSNMRQITQYGLAPDILELTERNVH